MFIYGKTMLHLTEIQYADFMYCHCQPTFISAHDLETCRWFRPDFYIEQYKDCSDVTEDQIKYYYPEFIDRSITWKYRDTL